MNSNKLLNKLIENLTHTYIKFNGSVTEFPCELIEKTFIECALKFNG